jgi:hypothetical protein
MLDQNQGLPQKPTKLIHHQDALDWLAEHKAMPGSSMITSLPDISEFPKYSLPQWKNWFINATSLVLSRCDPDGVSIFFQTDIKRDGAWVDKSFLIQSAAQALGHELLAHKIVCKAPPGTVTFGRPSYSHLLCFSKNLRPDVSLSLLDVLPDAGEVSWTRGMGLKACHLACQLVQKYTTSHTIIDPFCGHGAVLNVASSMGFHAIGVEISKKRANRARLV